MLASLAQAGLYGLEGNSELAVHYLSQSLMIGLAGPVGVKILGALSKMGTAAKIILGIVLGAQSMYTAGVAGINLYNSASKIVEGLLNGDMSLLDAFCEGSVALNSAAGIYYSLKGLLGGCELALKGLDDVAASYAAKQEAWYKEHAGYTTNNLDNIQESGASVMPQSVADARNNMNYTPQTVNKTSYGKSIESTEFFKENGGLDASDYISIHSRKHMYNPDTLSTPKKTQYGKDVNVGKLCKDTIMNPDEVVYNTDQNVMIYKKKYPFNISTSETPTGTHRVFIPLNTQGKKTIRMSQFPLFEGD